MCALAGRSGRFARLGLASVRPPPVCSCRPGLRVARSRSRLARVTWVGASRSSLVRPARSGAPVRLPHSVQFSRSSAGYPQGFPLLRHGLPCVLLGVRGSGAPSLSASLARRVRAGISAAAGAAVAVGVARLGCAVALVGGVALRASAGVALVGVPWSPARHRVGGALAFALVGGSVVVAPLARECGRLPARPGVCGPGAVVVGHLLHAAVRGTGRARVRGWLVHGRTVIDLGLRSGGVAVVTQSSLSLFASPSPSVATVWAFGGSRVLSPEASAVASAAALALLQTGAGLVVGCCTGADAAALSVAASAGLAAQVSVFSAFGAMVPPGRWPLGSCPASAIGAVHRAVSAGASLRSWAGGGVSVPLSARLAARTRAVARSCTEGAVVVLAPGSRGALILARSVMARGLPVVAVPVSGAALPAFTACGTWSLVRSGPLAGLGAWQFV